MSDYIPSDKLKKQIGALASVDQAIQKWVTKTPMKIPMTIMLQFDIFSFVEFNKNELADFFASGHSDEILAPMIENTMGCALPKENRDGLLELIAEAREILKGSGKNTVIKDLLITIQRPV